MNPEELNRLLDKYYSGRSSEEEEKLLCDYFGGDTIHEGYEAEHEIFAYYRSARNVPEPSVDFEARIMAGLDGAEIIEEKFLIRRYLYPLVGAAASILILFGSYFFLSRDLQPKDTFTDPKIAYLETRKILFEVSSKMNKAEMALEPVGKIRIMTTKGFSAINKSTGIVSKNLKSLERLDGATKSVKNKKY